MAQDCNLVAYSGIALTMGYNAGTAIFESDTYYDSGNGPCSLVVSSTPGGYIAVVDSTGTIVFQEPTQAPAPPPLTTTPPLTSIAPLSTSPPPVSTSPPSSSPGQKHC